MDSMSDSTPHSRGSTKLALSKNRELRNPAPKGIHPDEAADGRRRDRFPQTPGDQPDAGRTHRQPATTPHPAHTGIDPGWRNGERGLQSRPRKRGDRPAEHTDPSNKSQPIGTSWIPRALGDRPSSRCRRTENLEAPADRGSTVDGELPGAHQEHLPRTHGDRPRFHGGIASRRRLRPTPSTGITPGIRETSRERETPTHTGNLPERALDAPTDQTGTPSLNRARQHVSQPTNTAHQALR